MGALSAALLIVAVGTAKGSSRWGWERETWGKVKGTWAMGKGWGTQTWEICWGRLTWARVKLKAS